MAHLEKTASPEYAQPGHPDTKDAASERFDDNSDHAVGMTRAQRSLTEVEKAEEAKLARKIDFRIVPIVFVLYLFCFIDRANIGNARLAGLEADLKLRGYDYNTLLSVFYVSYIVFEIPSNLACKHIGPGKWIPIMVMTFGMLSICTAFCKSLGSACAVRFLLGASEAGMLPGVAYYLSRWYRKSELVFRLSLYLVASPLAGAFGGLLASGILKIDNIGSLTQWEMIFAVEGIVTVGLGIIAWFILTDRPETATWLTAEEKALAERRITSENLSSTVLDKMHTKGVLAGILSVNTLVLALIFLLNNITVQGIAVFTPTIIKTIYPKASTIQLQLRTVPPYIVGAFGVLSTAYIGWKTDRRGPLLAGSVPLVIIGYSLFLGSSNPSVRYGASFLITTGCFCFGAIVSSWAAANVTCDTSRASAIATVVMGGNIGGLIATWSFLPAHAPNYVPGNALNLATSTLTFILVVGLILWQVRENRMRASGKYDHRLEGKTAEEAEALGVLHPSFRYRY